MTRHLKKVPKLPVYQDSQLRIFAGEREVPERRKEDWRRLLEISVVSSSRE